METGHAPAPSRQGSGIAPGIPIAVAVLAVAAGLVWWRPWDRGAARAPGAFRPFTAPPVDLSRLPRGGVLLVHPESGRLYVLRTRPPGTPAADEVLALRELRYQAGQPTVDTGNTYRLDAARGRLTTPGGQSYPVTVDGGSGLIEVQQAGTLRIQTQPAGLPVLIDGRAAGPSPVSVKVRAGRHQVQVRGARGRVLWDAPVEVPARTPVTIAVPAAFTSSGAGRSQR